MDPAILEASKPQNQEQVQQQQQDTEQRKQHSRATQILMPQASSAREGVVSTTPPSPQEPRGKAQQPPHQLSNGTTSASKPCPASDGSSVLPVSNGASITTAAPTAAELGALCVVAGNDRRSSSGSGSGSVEALEEDPSNDGSVGGFPLPPQEPDQQAHQQTSSEADNLSPSEESQGVWMSQAPCHGGATAGGGSGGGGSVSPPDGTVAGGMGPRQTGGEVAAGEASIEAATAQLSLDDNDHDGGGDDSKVGGSGSVVEEGLENKSPRGGHWQDGEDRMEEREREPQPKFGLKVLVPGITAGCLIGKGGRIINQLQTTTGTRVKLSQKNEFFPGTHDRVALVQGEQPGMVAEAVAEMLRRLREAGRQHPHAPPVPMGVGYSPGGQEGGFNMVGGGLIGGGGMDGGLYGSNAQVTVRLLVPLAAGGLIIGKGGETIKAIAARTGAHVTLAGKDANVAGVPSERLCSIQGDLEGVIKVVLMIVGKMSEDRGLSKYQSNQTCYQGGLTASIAPSGLGMGLPMGGGDVGVVGPVDNAQQQQHLSNTSSGPCVSNHSPPMHQPQQQQHQQQQPPWGRPRLLSGGDMGTFCGTIPGQQGGGVLPAGQGMNGGAGGQGPRMNGQGFGPRPAARHQMGPVNPWVGVNDPDNGPPPTALQGQVMGSPPAAMGGAGGGVIANGVSPGIGIPGGGVGGSVGGISVQQQQQQQQQAALVSGHVPAMMAGGGMVYGYPYPVPTMQPQRPFGDAFAQANLGAMQPMYPYGNEMPLVPPTAGHPGPLPEVLMDGEVLAQTQVAVPDQMVGVILGKGGATVIDMQNLTGARIQVSQRGEYIPGTHNRPVTISGTQQAVANAQMMVHTMCTQAAQYEFRQMQGMHHQQQPQPPFY